MNSRLIKAILACSALGVAQGCTTTTASLMEAPRPVLVSLSAMESEEACMPVTIEPATNPLCVSAGDGLGQSLWAWHLFVSTEPVEYLAIAGSD